MLSKRQEAFNPNRQRACLCVRLNVMAALFRLINLNRLVLNRSSYIGQSTDCLRMQQRQQVRKACGQGYCGSLALFTTGTNDQSGQQQFLSSTA